MQEEEYKQIIRRYGGEIRAFIGRMVPQRCDADELTQDTFVKAFRSISSYGSCRGEIKHWLMRIAYREALMYLRRHKQHTCYLEDDERLLSRISDDEADRMLSEMQEQRIRNLEDAIRKLSPEDQTLLQLYYNEGMRLRQIAEIMGHDAAYLATRLQRIRKRLCVMIKSIEDGYE